MQKLKIFMFWCLLIGTLVSCGDKKEDDPTPSAASQDYFPLTAGTSWNYGGNMPYSVKVTANTSVIDGKTYQELELTQGSTTTKSYMINENNVYSGIGIHPMLGSVKVVFLKANAAVGESWQQTVSANGAENKHITTMLEKDISKTAGGKTYNNVIHTKMESSLVFMGTEVPFATTHYYFAKGVGLILTEATSGTQVVNVPLTSYTIK